jgi:hypothetical protein
MQAVIFKANYLRAESEHVTTAEQFGGVSRVFVT